MAVWNSPRKNKKIPPSANEFKYAGDQDILEPASSMGRTKERSVSDILSVSNEKSIGAVAFMWGGGAQWRVTWDDDLIWPDYLLYSKKSPECESEFMWGISSFFRDSADRSYCGAIWYLFPDSCFMGFKSGITDFNQRKTGLIIPYWMADHFWDDLESMECGKTAVLTKSYYRQWFEINPVPKP